MIVAGIDLGKSKAALSIFTDGELSHVEHLELADMSRPVVLWALAQFVYGFTKTCDQVFIEEPLIGRNTRNSLEVAQTCGAVIAVHGQIPGRQVHLVPVATWKKAVVGKGNADKKYVRDWLDGTHSAYAARCGNNQDRIDATCIGLYGAHIVGIAGKLDIT